MIQRKTTLSTMWVVFLFFNHTVYANSCPEVENINEVRVLGTNNYYYTAKSEELEWQSSPQAKQQHIKSFYHANSLLKTPNKPDDGGKIMLCVYENANGKRVKLEPKNPPAIQFLPPTMLVVGQNGWVAGKTGEIYSCSKSAKKCEFTSSPNATVSDAQSTTTTPDTIPTEN